MSGDGEMAGARPTRITVLDPDDPDGDEELLSSVHSTCRLYPAHSSSVARFKFNRGMTWMLSDPDLDYVGRDIVASENGVLVYRGEITAVKNVGHKLVIEAEPGDLAP